METIMKIFIMLLKGGLLLLGGLLLFGGGACALLGMGNLGNGGAAIITMIGGAIIVALGGWGCIQVAKALGEVGKNRDEQEDRPTWQARLVLGIVLAVVGVAVLILALNSL